MKINNEKPLKKIENKEVLDSKEESKLENIDEELIEMYNDFDC
jgi:hypothetical protein